MSEAPEQIDQCARTVRRFAEQSCRAESPLYEQLCVCTADDRQLLEIVLATPQGQPIPNLFLGAIHYLLLEGAEHDLAGFYRSCVSAPKPHQHAFPAFRDFCLASDDAIRGLLAQRRVQTNEVRRCAYLLPAFAYVAGRTGARSLAIVDVGASAGLNLIWDRYTYDYGTGHLLGNPAAPVRITTELKGNRRPPLSERLPAVAHRVGIDLHVPDVNNPVEALWLRALIWPDQPQRIELLTSAIEDFRQAPPDLLEGDALRLLPDAIRDAPADATACVLHCHTLNQFSEQQRQAFDRVMAEASSERPVVEVSAEWIFTATPELQLRHWLGGKVVHNEHLANVDHHGRWIEWLAAMD